MRPPHHIGAQHKAIYTVTAFIGKPTKLFHLSPLFCPTPTAFYSTMAMTLVEDFATRNSGMYCILIYIFVSRGQILSYTPSLFVTLVFSLHTSEYNSTLESWKIRYIIRGIWVPLLYRRYRGEKVSSRGIP